jgi:hypothetical protein
MPLAAKLCDWLTWLYGFFVAASKILQWLSVSPQPPFHVKFDMKIFIKRFETLFKVSRQIPKKFRSQGTYSGFAAAAHDSLLTVQ